MPWHRSVHIIPWPCQGTEQPATHTHAHRSLQVDDVCGGYEHYVTRVTRLLEERAALQTQLDKVRRDAFCAVFVISFSVLVG